MKYRFLFLPLSFLDFFNFSLLFSDGQSIKKQRTQKNTLKTSYLEVDCLRYAKLPTLGAGKLAFLC